MRTHNLNICNWYLTDIWQIMCIIMLGDSVCFHSPFPSIGLQHLAIACHWSQRAAVIGDVIQVYSGSHGRSIVFCETKKDASELSMNASIKQVPICSWLHFSNAFGILIKVWNYICVRIQMQIRNYILFLNVHTIHAIIWIPLCILLFNLIFSAFRYSDPSLFSHVVMLQPFVKVAWLIM